jgi:hypothetical protein
LAQVKAQPTFELGQPGSRGCILNHSTSPSARKEEEEEKEEVEEKEEKEEVEEEEEEEKEEEEEREIRAERGGKEKNR